MIRARGIRALLVAAVLTIACLHAPGEARAQGNLALASRDGIDAWAVGDSGRYYRTLDGGASWDTGTLGARALRGVAARALHVVIVGDSGRVWHSADAGGAWTLATVPGAPALRALDMTDDSTGYAVGDAGTVVRLTAHGTVLTALPSGLGARLDAVRFSDSQHGWVAGAGGLAARTSDGGASWAVEPLGTSRALRAVDVRGAVVWLVGDDAAAYRSTDGGTSFTAVELGLDARADVRAVRLAGADTVWLAGGGGFLRRSTDGGATWSWPVHGFHGPVGALAFAGSGGFLCGTRTRAVLSSTDGGATWSLPAGTVVGRAWNPRLTFSLGVAQVRGNTLAMNPVYKTEFLALLGFTAGGVKLYRSLDEGDTWSQLGPTLPGFTRANALIVSPRDSSTLTALVTDPGQVLKSTDGGLSWTAKLTRPYGEYGVPLAADPDHPDTLLFGGDTTGVWRSLDAGESWAPWGSTVFREPCDIKFVPGRDSVVLLTDGVSGLGFGEGWRSTDAGKTWSLSYTGSGQTSELPELAVSRLRPATAFATAWRSDGTLRSTDWGATWSVVNPTNPAWGIAIAHDDPNVIAMGLYGNGTMYLSTDAGASWTAISIPGANYSFLARDRATILAQQSNGIHKLAIGYAFSPVGTQALTLLAPAGGESWDPGTVHAITWDPTRIAAARLEYRVSAVAPWQPIAVVAGDLGRWDWTVPATPTGQAQVRVSDAWDGVPADSSANVFTITTVAVGAGRAPVATLAAARPNPFTRATEIGYTLAERTRVRLEVFDVQGQRVALLVEGWQEAGTHAAWFGGGAPARGSGVSADGTGAGIYFVRLTAGRQVMTRKLVRLR